jgi:DNA-binding beta-propeller fold protein YncE
LVDLGRESGAPPRLARVVDLPGGFDFDTFSPDGSTLYVIEHLDDRPAGHYQVRAVDVATGALDPIPVADKSTDAEPMYGSPITQLPHAGTVFTLYRGPDHPFVHALSSVDRFAVCLDLPATGFADEAAALDWALVNIPSGGVDAVNATLGLAAEIDPSQLSITRSVTLPATSAAARAPRIQLAKFGHGQAGAVGRRAVVTPDGGTIVAGGRDGLVAIATRDLSVEWRALAGEAVTGVGLSPDGSTVYVLLGSGRIVVVSSTDGSSLGVVPGEGFDRLLAVAEG